MKRRHRAAGAFALLLIILFMVAAAAKTLKLFIWLMAAIGIYVVCRKTTRWVKTTLKGRTA